MKIFLLIGMFSLCFIKESGAVPGDSNDCEKTYTNLITLHRLNHHLSQKISALTKNRKKATESKNQANVDKHTAAINKIHKQQIDLTNKVHSDHFNKSCLSGEDVDAKFLAYKNDKPSQERLKERLQKVEVEVATKR